MLILVKRIVWKQNPTRKMSTIRTTAARRCELQSPSLRRVTKECQLHSTHENVHTCHSPAQTILVGLLCVLVLHPLTWRHGCVIYGTVQWRSFVLSEVETGLALRGQASQQAHTGPDSTPLEIATGLRTFFFNYRIFREVCLPRIKIVSTVKFEWVNFFALSVNFHEQSFKVVCGVRLAINSITNLVNMAAFRILTEIWFK